MAFKFDPTSARPVDSEPQFKFDASSATPELEQDNALVRGAKQMSQSVGITKDLALGDAAGVARRVKEADDYNRANPGSKEGQELSQAWDKGDGVWGGVKNVAGEIAKDWNEAPGIIGGVRSVAKNAQAMGAGIIAQVPNMVPSMTGMIAGGVAGAAAGSAVPIVGNVVGGAVGAFTGASAGNTLVEGGGMLMDRLNKAGINPQDTAAVEAYVRSQGDSTLGDAAIKGSIIGAVDTATAGLGGKLLNAPVRAATDRALSSMGVDMADKAAVKTAMKSDAFKAILAQDATLAASKTGVGHIAREAGVAALDPAGEFAGEYIGQGVATGDWDAKNAALEAISSVGQSGMMYAGQKAYQHLTNPLTGGDALPSAGGTPSGSEGNPLMGGAPGAVDSTGPDLAAEARAAARSRARALGEEELARDMGPQTEPPDGAAALAKQKAAIEADRIARMERDRAVETPDDEIYQSTGVAERVVRPSQVMGINPAHGALSNAAALGVDAAAERSSMAPDGVDSDTGEVTPLGRAQQLRERIDFMNQQGRAQGWNSGTVAQRNTLMAELRALEGTADPKAASAELFPITADARSLLDSIDAGGVPVIVTNNMRRIARENGIEVTRGMNPNDVIQALRDRAIQAPSAPVPQTELFNGATTSGTQTNQTQQGRAEPAQGNGTQAASIQRDNAGGDSKAAVERSEDQQSTGATARGKRLREAGDRGGDAGNQQSSIGLNSNAATPQNNGAQAAPTSSPQTQTPVSGEDRAREIAREGNEARRQRAVTASAEWARMTEAQRQEAAAQAKGLNPVAKKSIHTRAWADLNQKHRDALVDVVAPRQVESSAEQTPAVPANVPPAAPTQPQIDAHPQEAAQPSSARDMRAIVAKQLPDMTTDELRQAATHYGPDHKRTAKIEKELAKRGESTPTPAADAAAQAEPVAKEIAGRDLGDGWAEYSPASGTKGIPRAEMPQIKAEHRGAMTNFMNARGIAHQEETVPAASLKPTQAEFSREKVAKAKAFTGGNRAILISRDGHVLDGHHQWMAAREKGEDVRAIRLDAPIDQLVKTAHEFPSSTVDNTSDAVTATADTKKPDSTPEVVDTKPESAAPVPQPTSDKPKARGVAGKLQAAREKKLAEEKARDDAEDIARRDYFTPGNIVHAYGGAFDRVVDYKGPHERNRWAVTVRAVENKDGKWVDVPGETNRTHWTRPSDREIKAGPVERVAAQAPLSDAAATSTAPEHAQVGVDERELSQIAGEFKAAQDSMVQDDERVHHLFDDPKKGEVVRLAEKVKVYNAEHGWMTVAEAKAEIAKWKQHAKEQGDSRANSDKVVLSLFDLTGKWSQPWEDAGYQVYRFDIQADPEVGDVNNFSTEFFADWFGDFDGQDIYAILAACPCTDFAVSGARHFAAKDADGRTVASVKLVHQSLATIEHFKPAVWAIENPVGRIEKLGGLPQWRLSFDPNHIGDPYTKKTLLWGRFNGDMPIAPVEPTEGSKMHSQYGGKSLATKNARSATPEGFAYGFFMANNAVDHPVMAVANKFDRLDRALIQKALDAGMSADQIESAVADHYFMDLDDGAAEQALRDEIAKLKGAADANVKSTSSAVSEVPEAPKEAAKMKNSSDVSDALDLGKVQSSKTTEERFAGSKPITADNVAAERERTNKKPSAEQTRAKADLMSALADLGDILGKNTRMNMLPEQEQKLLPVLTRVLDAAFRMGYHKFKDSAKFALEQIREHIGADAADALTLDHLQGAYIAMAGGKPGADTKRAVIDVEIKAEIEQHTATAVQEQADTTPEVVTNERTTVQGDGPKTLEPVAAGESGGVEGNGRARIDTAGGRDERAEPGAGADAAGVQSPRSGGSRTERVHSAETGAGTGDGGRGRKLGRVKADPAKAAAEKAIGKDTRPEVAGEPASAPNIPAADFQITDDTRLGQGGEVQKFNDNLSAIRTLKAIEDQNRRATPDEQAALARYVGWGGLANAFPDPLTGKYKPAWEARGKELRELLGDAEYAAARRSTRNAHYTSKPVVQAMWRAVERLGFKGGLALESSMGVGNFLGLKPQGTPASFVGVEYDSLTSRIAQALYPQATVLHSGFQNVPLADNAFALSIGNPPFGSESLRFQYKPELNGTSIHNQFFRASMDALRPGGIQAMVVSRFLMDAKDKSTRLALAKQSKLIAAIRLPDTAFKENARTEVVTDIIILQKLTPAEQAEMSVAVDAYLQRPEKNVQAEQERKALAAKVPAWVETTQVADPLGGEAMTVNGYFRDNKANIIGVMERSGSMQHGADLTVRLDDVASLESRLNAVVDGLPQNIQDFGAEVLADTEQRHKSMSDALRIALAGQEVGHIQLNRDGKIERVVERETPEGGIEMGMQVITADSPWSDQLMQDDKGRWYRTEVVMGADGKAVKALKADGSPSRNNLTQRVTYEKEAAVPESLRLGKTGFERLQAAVGLRDSLKRQITLETADAAKGVMEANRKELAKRYEDFVKRFGPVNRPANLNLIMTMPDGGLTAALEVAYQPEVTAARAKSSGLPQTAELAKPAPILTSRVVPKYEPATTADSPSDALVITLSERGRVDMDRIAELRSVSLEEAAEQLQAGEKPLVFKDPESEQWETADAYLSGNVRRKLNAARAARMDANVKALEAVQPAAWGAEDVTVMLGSTWVPPKVYADFADHLSGGTSKASFSAATNSFSLTISNQTKAAEEWSSQGAPVQYILSRLMNSQPVVVMFKDENGTLKRDAEATALAQLKAKEINAEFLDWVFKDGERRTALVDLFNEKYNTRVVRQRDGSHLQLPGKVPDSIIGMRRHQKNVIWRGITDNSLLMDHAVGAGKTFAAIARSMERRRMGLSKKPMIVVPNHLIDQWASDVYRLYPGAKVLAAGKKDFETKRRRRLFGKIATGDWDIVLVPHSSFGFIGIDSSTEQRFLQMEMDQALEAVKDAEEQAAEDGTDSGRRKPFGVKEAERLVEKIQTRMDKLNSGPRDRLLTFEQLGVDDLTIDEAHEFKNLYYSSRMTGVRGMGDKTGSRKANDLYNKVRVLQENPANAVSFLTGTPISNSAVEMYTVMRYLAPQQLKEMGLEHFDAWRAQFVEASAAFEPTESGSLKEVTRLGRSWSNMRSLMDLYYEFTDAVSLEDIQRWYSEDNGGKAFPVPKVKGGDRQLVNVQPTPAQEEMLKEVIQGFDGLPTIKDPYERNAERLRLMDRARKVSLDVRAVDPSSASTEEGGKLAQASANIKRIYDATSADHGTQMVFLDRSVPKAKGDDKIIKEYDALIAKRSEALAKSDDAAFQSVQEAIDRFDANEIAELRNAQNSGWNAYQQIKDNLVSLGIPANEIRFIQEANNDEQKQALFDAVNGGKVRVLLGSSQRMGAGTNAQKRLVGLHHIDVTWKPSDIEQREGRIIRQGNELLAKYGDKFEVEIMAYATERTVDAKMWDLNATKLKTINGIRKYDGAFSMDFEDADSVSMAEMAALASGNPLLLERVKTESELNMLELQERAFRRKMYGAQDAVQDAERTIARNPDRIIEARANESRAQQAMDGAYSRQAARTVEVEGKTFTKLSDAYGAAKEATESQQAGKPNARYAVSVNGKRLTSKDAIESAISESLGDASVFEATIGGKDVFQRVGAARELVTEMNKLTAGMVAGDSRSKVVGKMLGFDLALDANAFEAGSAGTLIDSSVSLVDASGATVLSIGVNEVAANQTFVTGNLRNPVSDLFQGVERMAARDDAAYLQKQLDRATKELPELRERLNQTFPKAEELTTKRARLRELVSLLDADNKSVQVAQNKDETSDNTQSDQANSDYLDAAHAGVKRHQAGQGSRVDRAVMDMARDGNNVRDILRFVADASTSRFNRQVARLLLKSEAIPKVNVLPVGGLGYDKNGFELLAKYSRQNNEITLTLGAQRMAEQIFLHEAIHAASLKALDRGGMVALQMRKLAEHIYKMATPAQRKQYGLVIDKRTGKVNVGEFMAEAFTNPTFQKMLRGMNAPAGNSLKSAWDSLVRILKTVLGLPAKSDDALSRALEVGVQVMREDKAMRQREARVNVEISAAREFLDGAPVASMNGDEVPKLGAQSLLMTWAAKHFENETVDGAVTHPVLGEVKLDRRSAKDSLSHGYGKNKIQALYILPEVIPRARILSEESRMEGQSGYVLGAPVEIGGQPYIVAMVVKKHEGRTGLYVHEVVLRERLQEAINTGAPAQANQAGQSSRGNPGAIRSVLQKIYSVNSASPKADANFGADEDHFFGAADLRGIKKSAIDQINQTFSHEGQVSRWFKSVGTMGHLAKLNPSFKPVFDSAQQFNDDISMLANDSANQAPRLIPRVEGMGDIIGKNRKTPVSAADNKAIAKPLTEGTLMWTRDLDGKPILADDKAKKYANVTASEKAQMMLKVGRLEPGVLKMWQGLPLSQFENIINSRFESKMLKPGIVWTPAELKSMFKMTNQQVALYDEARNTVDRSIDMTARADMLRVAGEKYVPMRDAVLEAPTMTDALNLLVETMEEEAKANPDNRDRLADSIQAMRNRFNDAEQLQKDGYFPLQRYGRYTVDVVDQNGERQYFGMFESARESNQMAIRMKSTFPGATVTSGTMSEKAFKLFQGVTPETMEMFGNMLGLQSEGNEAQDKAFQEYLKLAKNNHSALKRLIHRKGIEGYSEDVGRVMASFVYSNARLGAGGLNVGTMDKAINEIPKEQGELKDVAVGLRSYIQDPQEEGQAIRGMLFAQYLGGSLASAFVNLTQPFAVTMPWLSQYGGMKKAGATIAKAFKDMSTKGFKYEADLASELKKAEDDGIVSPQEIHFLMAQMRGAGTLRSGDGTKTGEARAAVANSWEKAKLLWGQPFAIAEQINRRSTFIAAYRTAKEQGMADPAEFARRAVIETQFQYSKANKPKWARGAVGGTLFTFKTYSVSYLELMHRMWTQGGKEGKRAVAWAAVMLLLMGGTGGLPFMEDLDDLIDGAGQLMGYNISTKHWRKQLLRDTVGKELGEFLDQGLSGLPGAPIDVSGRLGMGNLIPGTGLFLTKPNRERDLMEIAGPAGDLVSRGFTAARQVLKGDVGGAALQVSPTAVRNAAKGIDMAVSGMYKDTKGYKVLDTTLAEAAAKFIGFQPKSVAEVQEGNSFMMRSKSFYSQQSAEIKAQWADALFRKDSDDVQRARDRLAAWNEKNPDQPIRVNKSDVWKKVREMNKDRTQRIADTAPKALRQQMRDIAKELH